MTEKFVASNGITVSMPGSDRVMFASSESETENWVGSHELDALREYFQHGRDTELGRWRWAADPKWLVYKKDPGCLIFNEKSGTASFRFTDDWEHVGTEPAHKAVLRAYLAAHPEPKPWHDAKPGEAWVITYGGEEHAVICDGAFFLWQAGSEQKITDPRIAAGRRIYPELP